MMNELSAKGVRTTVPIDLLLSFLVGELCALMGSHMLSDREPWGPPFRYALAFGAFIFYPIGLILMVFFPAWSWMYFIDPAAYPPLLGMLAVYGYVLALVLGYTVCVRYCRGPLARRIALLTPLIFLVALMIVTFDRLWYVGSFDDFINGRALPLLQTSLAWVLTLVTVAFLWGLAGTLRAITRLQRRQGDQ